MGITKNAYPNLNPPIGEELYVVTRGLYNNQQDAKPFQKLLKEVMGKQSADTLIESDLLEGFPQKQWVLATFFDSEKKARWWMKYSDRNLKLPKMELKKTKLLKESSALTYFPESLKGNQKRFFSEQEAIEQVKSLKDIQDLNKQTELNFKITSYPRLDALNYEVEVLKKNNQGKFVVHDFITLSARDISQMSRFSKP